MPGIDGKVELTAELDRLGRHSAIAANAPCGTGLANYLATGIENDRRAGHLDGPSWRLTVDLIQRLSIWWSPSAYGVLPVMTPWCIRDRSARYDQGPEMWGAPRADGYLRDDNSIIKKLPLPLSVHGLEESTYSGRKPWRGFTACHIWRELEDGTIGGADKWIYSFMPNLVWLPSPLSSLTDHHPRVRMLLQRTSQLLFYGNEGTTTRDYTSYVWSKLTPMSASPTRGPSLDAAGLAFFNADLNFVARRLAYIDAFVEGVDRVLSGGPLTKRLICTRYTTGMPQLAPSALKQFRAELDDYRNAVRSGL